MRTEEFILIPKRMFASHQPVKKEVLDNPLYKQKAAQLSLLQRNQSNSMEKPEKAFEPVETANKLMIETAEEEKTEPMSEDSEIEPVVKKQRKSDDFTSIMIELEVMNKNQIKRSKIILDLINQSETVTIESNDVLHVNKETLGIKASTFLYNLQQPTKKIDIEKYSKFYLLLISHLILLQIHMPSKSWKPRLKVNKNFSQVENNPVNKSSPLLENDSVAQNQPEKSIKKKRTKRQTKKRPVRRCGLSFPEVKKMDQLYLKGPASYGSIKRLQTQSKLPIGKVLSYLETKPSFTKYRSIRLKFTRLKVFVKKNINEIWSLDLAHVDKLAKYNRNIKYLLVAFDCLSRYLRVEPLKTKYATEAAEAFKKMIKNKQPEKVWVDDGTKFLGEFKKLCNKRGIQLNNTFSEKKSAFAERNIRSLKKIIHRYLEEKWTYSYIDQLDQFVKTINSRVNRVTKIAPNKVTKKDVPRLVSLTVQTSSNQKPKFYIGDFVRIVKKDKAFRKSYKQSFTDEVFEITRIPTLSPPTYSLVDTDKEPIQGKFYQSELQLVRLPLVENVQQPV